MMVCTFGIDSLKLHNLSLFIKTNLVPMTEGKAFDAEKGFLSNKEMVKLCKQRFNIFEHTIKI